jgi:hypothetical protein
MQRWSLVTTQKWHRDDAAITPLRAANRRAAAVTPGISRVNVACATAWGNRDGLSPAGRIHWELPPHEPVPQAIRCDSPQGAIHVRAQADLVPRAGSRRGCSLQNDFCDIFGLHNPGDISSGKHLLGHSGVMCFERCVRTIWPRVWHSLVIFLSNWVYTPVGWMRITSTPND